MQTLENESTVIPFPTNETITPVAQGNYEAVRFNAVQHGILSQLVVLPHEDASEFTALLAALIDEHKPSGITERHLVDELAAAIWRKRRVLQAEGATINRSLRAVVSSEVNSPIPAAVPFERGLSGRGTDLRDLMTITAEEIAEQHRECALDLQATERAAMILRKGTANAYEKALRALLPDSRDCWEAHIEENPDLANTQGLSVYISETLFPISFQMEKEARYHYAIKAQTMGEGLQAYKLEKLNRYETHLDRKFERTLGMLLKLKEMRSR